MAITFRSKQWAVQGGGTSLAPTEPAGAAQDDIILGKWIVGDAHSGFSLPAGWTQKGANLDCGNFHVYFGWIRRGSSAPSFTASWTTSQYAECVVAAYSGCVTSGDPFDDFQEAALAASGFGPDGPSATSTVANTMALSFGAHWSGSGSAWTAPTTPSAWTMRSGASGDDVGFAELALPSAQTVDPDAFGGFGVASGDRYAATAILKPAATGGPNITAQPSNAHVVVGATATFSVTASATGGGSLSYQWKKNGTNVSGGSGGTTASYTTGTLGTSDDGATYTCDVTETGGSSPGTVTSSAGTLRVGVIFVAAGTIAYSAASGTSVAPAYPAGLAAGDLLVMVLGQKPSSANGGTATTPSSPWALDGSRTGANDGDTGGYTTTLAADTGNCNIYQYSKECTGSESGTLSVTVGTNDVSWAQMLLLRKPSGASWSVATVTGKDTAGGNVSITGGSDPGVAAGDYVVAAMVIPTDVTTPAQFSAEAFSQTGVTFGTVTEHGEPDSTNGNDIGGVVFGAPVTAGPSSAAPTFTATAGGTTTNVRGPGIFARIRATAGGTNTPMTVSATHTQTTAVGRGLGAAKSGTISQVLSRVRALSQTRSATQTQTPSRSRDVTRAIALATHTTTPSQARSVGRSASATQAQAATLAQRAVARVLALVQSQAPSLAKALPRAHSVTQAQTPSVRRDAPKLYLVTQTQAPTRTRDVARPRSVAQAQTASAPARAVSRALLFAATQTLSLARALARALNAAGTATATLNTSGGGSQAMTLSATVSQTLSLVRASARTIASGSTQTPTRARAVARQPLSATHPQTPSVAKGSGRFVTVSATVTQTLTRLRSLGLGRLRDQAQTLAQSRALGLRHGATQQQAPSKQRSLPRQATATVTQTPSVSKGSGYYLTIAAAHVQTAARSIGLGVARVATQAQAATLGRALGIARSLAQTQVLTRLRDVVRALLGGNTQTPNSGQNAGASYDLELEAAQVQSPTLSASVTTFVLCSQQDTVAFRPETDTINFVTSPTGDTVRFR